MSTFATETPCDTWTTQKNQERRQGIRKKSAGQLPCVAMRKAKEDFYGRTAIRMLSEETDSWR